jgi:hypothetical protein
MEREIHHIKGDNASGDHEASSAHLVDNEGFSEMESHQTKGALVLRVTDF